MSGAEITGERTLSWRSKNRRWWNSTVQLRSNPSCSAKLPTSSSSSLALKIDQPASNQKEQQYKLDQQQQSLSSGVKLPWKHLPSQQGGEMKASELRKPVGEKLPIPTGPLTAADLQSLSKVGESCHRTKRLPVDKAHCKTNPNNDDGDNNNGNLLSSCSASLQAGGGLSNVSQRFLRDDAQINALPSSSNSMEYYLPRVESHFQNTIQCKVSGISVTPSSFDADVKHMNEASLILSEGLLSPPSNHSFAQPLPHPPEKKSVISSQQLERGESKDKTPFVHVTNVEPAAIQKDDIFPRNTNTLLPIRLQTSSSSISTDNSRKLGNLLLFESQYAHALSKGPALGGSMRVVRDVGVELESSAATAPVSLPTTPRAQTESRASRLLRRLKLFGGGGKGSHGRGTHVGQEQQPKSHKQDMPPPAIVIRAQIHGKKDSKALKAGSSVTTKERSLKLAEGDCMQNSFQSSQLGQCSDEDSSKVAKTQQRKLNNRWPFNKWKWSSRSQQNKVVSEEDHHNNVHTIRSFIDASQEFSTTSETMYDAYESFSDRFVRFYSPQQLEKLSSLDSSVQQHHRRGSSWGSGTDFMASSSSHQLLPPPVPCNGPAAAITDLKMLYSNGPKTTRAGEPVTLSSAAGCQALKDSQVKDSGQAKVEEEENMAEVIVDCEGGSESRRFVKKQTTGLWMESEEELEWEEMHTAPLLPQEQNLTIEDVVTLCSSPIKFLFKCSEIEHFNKFLRAQKKRLISSSSLHPVNNNNDCFHIIRSGAECDVSSMVNALLMVWLMEHTVARPPEKTEKWHLVPVMNIPRQSMHNHKDAAWLFDACGIDAHALLFSDEIEFEKLMEAGRLKTQDIGQDLLVMKNEVGSVCTLLGEQLQMEAQCLLQARYTKTLLLAGILLDTENLDFASRRDMEMATALLVGCGSLGRNGFYKQLREVEGEARVSKLVTRMYGEAPPQLPWQSKSGEETEADHEHSDKDSYFSSADGHCSHDQTSTSEASNSSTSTSSLDEDSPRLQTLPTALPAKNIISASALSRFHRLPSPSGVIRRSMEAKAAAQIRQAAGGNQNLQPKTGAATDVQKPPPPPPRRRHPKSGNSALSRIRKKLLYNA